MKQDRQQGKTIGYLGPRGTYSEEAALLVSAGGKNKLQEYRTIDQAIRAVMDGSIDECVVPMENSLEGAVTVTLDTLAHDVRLYIRQEMVLPVGHHLLVKEETEQIDVIISHPQALAQCRRYLSETYPQAEVRSVNSTAEAASLVAAGAPRHGAVGSRRSAELYGLTVKAEHIQDYSTNCTRFVVLGREEAEAEAGQVYKTSVACQINGRKPGSLCEILQEFSERSVNLSRIESRPARSGLGAYIFFLDIEGGCHETPVREAVEAVTAKSQWFKSFGSYPVEFAPAPQQRQQKECL